MSKKKNRHDDLSRFHSEPEQMELFFGLTQRSEPKPYRRLLRHYLAGAARVLDIGSSLSYRGTDDLPGFYVDRIAQASDWIAVGKDITYALAKYKESQGDGKTA
jgi:hypothetical protein